MESSHNNHDIVIDRLINFFYKLSGNRAMPNLFPNVFSEEVLEKYGNKSKQLSYLFTIYKQKEDIEDLLNILIGNLSWTEDLEEKLNDIIEPLDLISLNGEVSKKFELVEQLTFGIRETFDCLQKLGITIEKIAKNACLLGTNPKSIQDRYDKLISLGISEQKIATSAHLLNLKLETIQNHHDKLRSLGISKQKISTLASLLGFMPETIQDHYDNLRRLGISHDKIATNPSLLNLNPDTIQDHYDKLIGLGIVPQKIAKNAQLLNSNPETIQDHYDNLRRLGISPDKIAKNPSLLNLNPDTIQDHYNKLIGLGLIKQKINDYPSLIYRNQDTIQDNYNYLKNILRLEENQIQIFPQILLFNPDAFARKLRIFKLDILGLKRKDIFNPNNYPQFYLASPATLLAKKDYCTKHSIDFLNNFTVRKLLWRNLIKRVDKTLTDKEANEKGKRITRPYKQRYDTWMGEYRKWCREFYLRRGRRLIVKV